MRKFTPVVVLAVCTWSCAWRRAGQAPHAPAGGQTGVAVTFQRHVINAVDAGDGDYLIRSLRERMAADPENLQIRLELARRYRQSGFPEIALEHYRLAAARFPEAAQVQLEMAKCLRGMNLRAQAAKGLEEFLRDHPQSAAEFASWLGILRDELGQWREGEAAHRAAVGLAPNLDSLHNNLGYNLLQQGRTQEAQEEFGRALALRPDSAVARNNLGLALAAQREQALRQLRAASDPATAHNNLACGLIEQGRYVEAREELEKALRYSRNHPAALSNLGLLSDLEGKAAVVPAAHQRPGLWRRLLSGLWKTVAGAQEGPRKAAENTASADPDRARETGEL